MRGGASPSIPIEREVVLTLYCSSSLSSLFTFASSASCSLRVAFSSEQTERCRQQSHHREQGRAGHTQQPYRLSSPQIPVPLPPVAAQFQPAVGGSRRSGRLSESAASGLSWPCTPGTHAAGDERWAWHPPTT